MSSAHGNQKVSDEEILAAFDAVRGPYATASELEEHLPIGRKGILKRLDDLEDRGLIKSKKPTPHMIGWWRSNTPS